MTTPRCGVTHDVVIYDGAKNLDPVGLIVRPYSYRVSEAPTLVPRMSIGDPKGLDYEGYISWVQDDFRGGEGQSRAPMPANNRYYSSQVLLPDQAEGYLGVGTFPYMNSLGNESLFSSHINYAGLNKRYYREQRRGWYLSEIGWGPNDSADRYITWRGVYKIGSPGEACERVFGWSDTDLSTIDAVKFSTCAIVALQGSFAGFVYPHKIRVHTHSGGHWLPHGNTSAAALATYDGHLWRADPKQPQICYYDLESVNDSINPNWSDYISVGADGDILAMTSFIGRLFIAKTNGIWAYEAGRSYQVIDLTHMAASRPSAAMDFNIFLEAHGALYWNIGNKLFRYTAGGLLEEMAAKLNEAPRAAAVVRRGLAIVTASLLWFLDTSTGGLYRAFRSPKKDIQCVGSRAGGLRIAPFQGSWMTDSREALIVPGATGIEMAGEPGFVPPQKTWVAATNLIHLETSLIDLGRPGLMKNWRRVIVRVEGIPSSSWPRMRVYLRTNELMYYYFRSEGEPPFNVPFRFNEVGILDNVNPITQPGIAAFEVPGNMTSRSAQVMITLETPTVVLATDERPTIMGIEVEGEPVQSIGRTMRRKQINLNAVVTDGLELLTGEVENSAAWIAAAIYSLAGTGRVHVVSAPFPPPVGHTFRARVELGPTGAVVPILPMSYTTLPSGCPGSDISLVLTEV